jgi:hypothetical protein
MPSTRIAKTLDKLRAGALPPAAIAVRAFKAPGTGAACSGCGEAIGRFESAYHVRVSTAEGLRLHTVCHETWIRFKRPA